VRAWPPRALAIAGSRRGILALCAALLPALASACGGSGQRQPHPPATRLLAQTFTAHAPASGGHVALALALTSAGGERLALRASGPFRLPTAGGAPSFALAIALAWKAPARPERSLPITLTAGPRSLSLTLDGRRVPLAPEASRALRAGYAQTLKGAPAPLGLQPAQWVVGPRVVGFSGRGPEASVHLTGALAVHRFASELGGLVGFATGLQQLAGAGQEASAVARGLTAAAQQGRGRGEVEVDSGARDHLLRALDVRASLTPPAGSREGAGRALKIHFALTFTGLEEARHPPAR